MMAAAPNMRKGGYTLQMLDPLDYRVSRQFGTASRMSCIYHHRFFGGIQALLTSGGAHHRIAFGRLEFCPREPYH